MTEKKTLEYIRVFDPQKLVSAYLGKPFLIYAVAIALVAPAYFFLTPSADEWILEIGSPALLILLDLIYDGLISYGIGTGKRNNLMYLRTAPDFRSNLEKALLCADIRRVIRYAIAYAISCVMLIACGYAPLNSILCCTAGLAMSMFLAQFVIYLVRVLRIGMAVGIALYFIMMPSATVICISMGIILESYAAAGIILTVIFGGLSFGVGKAFRNSVINRAVDKKTEGSE